MLNFFKIMKTKKILFTLSIICLFSACDVLDQKPKSAVSSDDVIYNAETAEIALNGLYGTLQSYYDGDYYIVSDMMADITQSVGTRNYYISMDTYTLNVDNLEMEEIWIDMYDTINQANKIIAVVPSLENLDQAAKDKILGQAYFIRALCYFDLNRAWGGVNGVYGTMGVPIVLKPTEKIAEENFPTRPAIDAPYAQVETDLKKTIELLSGAPSHIRATEAAAKALLSRLYLYYNQDYALVEQYATSVIEDYNYTLVDDFADIFITEGNTGSIFELDFTNSDPSGIRTQYFPPAKGGRGEGALHLQFVKLLQSRPNDERAQLIGFSDAVDAYYPTKYQKLSGTDNIIVLRLAEMYLNRAEARVKKATPDITGALADLNEIRNRAELPDTTGAGVDTAEEILGAIAVERNIEFFEEGHRWFNLIRTGRALAVLSNVDRANSGPVSLPDGYQVWPIPQREIDANKKIKQNDAYK